MIQVTSVAPLSRGTGHGGMSRASRPGIVSRRRNAAPHFTRQNAEAPRYPSSRYDLTCSAPSLEPITESPFTGFSPLSSSRPAFSAGPRPCHGPASRVATSRAPGLGKRYPNPLRGTFTPIAHSRALVTGPAWGICARTPCCHRSLQKGPLWVKMGPFWWFKILHPGFWSIV